MISKIQLDFQFSSAHFYHNKNWTTKKNKDVFGKCYDTHGHGHDYNLSLFLVVKKGISPLQVRAEVEEKLQALDHHHLNHAISWFQDKVPTTENLTLYLLEILKLSELYELTAIELKEDPYLGARVSIHSL